MMTTMEISCKLFFTCSPSMTFYVIQGVPKNPQTTENNLLLEFQWPSINLLVKSAKFSDRVHILSIELLRGLNIFGIFCPNRPLSLAKLLMNY